MALNFFKIIVLSLLFLGCQDKEKEDPSEIEKMVDSEEWNISPDLDLKSIAEDKILPQEESFFDKQDLENEDFR